MKDYQYKNKYVSVGYWFNFPIANQQKTKFNNAAVTNRR